MSNELLAWFVMLIGFGICFYFIIRTLVFARSLLHDAPYVPVGKEAALKALELLEIKEKDRFVDIGSSNGAVVLLAAKLTAGKTPVSGVEISWWLVLASRIKSILSPYRKSMRFFNSDMFSYDYSEMNKVFLFLTTDLVSKLMPKIEKELPKGSRIVSVMFKFPEEFLRKNKVEVVKSTMWGKPVNLYLWKKK